jgi:hypothetical protein
MEQQFHALPGVKSVGISSYTPMEDNNSSDGIQVQGQPYLEKAASWVRANSEYFDSVGTRVVMGRGFQPQDTFGSPGIALVTESYVREFFKPGTNPIGQHFGSQGEISPGDFEIVGIVEDTAYSSIYWKNHSMFFVPTMQRPKSSTNPIENDLSLYAGALVIQTERPMPQMEQQARATLSSINPNLAIVNFRPSSNKLPISSPASG